MDALWLYHVETFNEITAWIMLRNLRYTSLTKSQLLYKFQTNTQYYETAFNSAFQILSVLFTDMYAFKKNMHALKQLVHEDKPFYYIANVEGLYSPPTLDTKQPVKLLNHSSLCYKLEILDLNMINFFEWVYFQTENFRLGSAFCFWKFDELPIDDPDQLIRERRLNQQNDSKKQLCFKLAIREFYYEKRFALILNLIRRMIKEVQILDAEIKSLFAIFEEDNPFREIGDTYKPETLNLVQKKAEEYEQWNREKVLDRLEILDIRYLNTFIWLEKQLLYFNDYYACLLHHDPGNKNIIKHRFFSDENQKSRPKGNYKKTKRF